jgi:hypothetical protein
MVCAKADIYFPRFWHGVGQLALNVEDMQSNMLKSSSDPPMSDSAFQRTYSIGFNRPNPSLTIPIAILRLMVRDIINPLLQIIITVNLIIFEEFDFSWHLRYYLGLVKLNIFFVKLVALPITNHVNKSPLCNGAESQAGSSEQHSVARRRLFWYNNQASGLSNFHVSSI